MTRSRTRSPALINSGTALPPASGVESLEFLQDVRAFERNDHGYSDIVRH